MLEKFSRVIQASASVQTITFGTAPLVFVKVVRMLPMPMVAMGINVSANTAGTGSMKLLDVGLTAREFTLYIYIEMGRPMI